MGHLDSDGALFVSGLSTEDLHDITELSRKLRVSVRGRNERDGWLALDITKSEDTDQRRPRGSDH